MQISTFKKNIFLLSVLFSTVIMPLQAQQVSLSQARQMADRHFQTQQEQTVRCADIVTDGTDTLLYIFNSERSFVVIAGDHRVVPVLACSDHQLYNREDISAPAQMWIDSYAAQIRELKKHVSRNSQAHPAWTQWLSRGMRDDAVVKPMMMSHWGQETFYNYYCPRDYAGDNNRVVTGCVATAMAQLLYYFRFPESGVGSYSYTDENYGVQSADYANATYNYEAMCDDPVSINTEISKLIYHLGVGVDMHYGVNGSGMNNHSAAYVLRTYFKYDPATEYLFRDSTDVNWDSVIVAHLERNIPMYYAGWADHEWISGHAFICDGYKIQDSCYYFHFNFGWDGSADGYFYTDNLHPGSSNFNLAQELIVNCYPDTALYLYPAPTPLTGNKVLTTTAGSFTDGTRPYEPYRNNMDYTWTIQPAESGYTSITVNTRYDLADGDTLLISSDNNTIAPLVLTNDSTQMTVSWDCTEITCRFISHQSNLEHKGFHINYSCSIPTYCPATYTYTAASGVISDGSDAEPYHNLTTCKQRIMLNASYNAVVLHITDFDLEEGHDFLRIFKTSYSDANLLTTLTGTIADTTLVIDNRRVNLLFETDEQNTAGGYTLEYFGGHVGVSDFEQTALQLWPNPASTTLSLSCEEPIQEVVIYDMQGRTVSIQTGQDLEMTIPVQQLQSGMYSISVRTQNTIHQRKFIKQQ
ncbi:MAG: C10 family peptidase [Bacteroidales bacterium]|nr:C10 family peptidase [Bacteroidales bacterium]